MGAGGMGKYLVPCLASLALGVLLGRSFPSGREIPPLSPAERRSEEAREILADSAAEISQIQDVELRQARLEETLGKLLKLFMIDVSLRLRQNPAAALVKSAEPPPPATTAEKTNPLPSTARGPDPAPANVNGLSPEQRKTWEVRVVQTGDRLQRAKFLNELSSMDFAPAFAASEEPKDEDARHLLGTYEGEVELQDGRKPWKIRIRVRQMESAPEKGASYASSVRIEKDGGVSESSGRGNLKGYTVGSRQPMMFFIEAGGDFMQLYKSRAFDGFTGLYLQGPNSMKMKAVGQVELIRTGR